MCGNEIPADNYKHALIVVWDQETCSIRPMTPEEQAVQNQKNIAARQQEFNYNKGDKYTDYTSDLYNTFTKTQLKLLDVIVDTKVNQILDEKKASEEASKSPRWWCCF